MIDPQKEAKRLRENSALGQSQETGDTPIVQPKQRAWLEGILAIEADLDVPHFIQVGAAPVFRGVGLGELVCRCGTVLIERYLPGNFLAIRIQCFRCGAVSSTPGLPDGEILTRARRFPSWRRAPLPSPRPTLPVAAYSFARMRRRATMH